MSLVCIDAGHGGKDPGASNGMLEEKNIALDIARKTNNILNHWGIDTVMTRDEDVFVKLEDRADIANNNDCDLFLSIHINAHKNSNANGIETYCYPGSTEGNDLANIVQDKLMENTNEVDRGVKEAEFVVLKETSMPAVLAELGFITNPKTLGKLSKDYINFLKAYSLAKAIKKYVEVL